MSLITIIIIYQIDFSNRNQAKDKQVKTITRFQEDDFVNFKKLLFDYISVVLIYDIFVENTVNN